MSYIDFIAAKARRFGDHGIDADSYSPHPMLHDWQADAVRWALGKGRSALFWDCGLGKTFAQVEWARAAADTALIVAPLSVARQTAREAARIGVAARYVRSGDEITGPGVWITSYEMVDRFDPARFGAVVLDESSILKNADGKVRTRLIETFRDVPMRLACTATPAPNDVAELANHAEFLGVMSRVEMLASYFVHDDEGWRMKGHAARPMFRWMATWAHALTSPADIGYPAAGYELPPLRFHAEIVAADIAPPEGQLFAADLGGVGGRARVRRETLAARTERAAAIANRPGQWIVWCGLNDEADAVARAVDGAVNVDGSMAPDAKAAALEAFQDGEIRVLVSKPAICGFGMNFQQAHQMVFVGLSDSYEAYYQSVRRCYRFGQTEPVDAHVVVSDLEQQIVTNVREKEHQAVQMTRRLVAEMNPSREAVAA